MRDTERETETQGEGERLSCCGVPSRIELDIEKGSSLALS